MQWTTLALKKLNVNNSRVIAWTDLAIVMSWLAGCPGIWGCSVANHVSFIQEEIPPTHWKNVLSKQNPVNCLSRGKNVKELPDFSLW